MGGLPSGIPDLKVSSSAESHSSFSGKVRTGDIPYDLTTGGGMRGGFANNVAFPGSAVIGADSGGTGGVGLKPLIYTAAVLILAFAAFIIFRRK